MSSQTVDQLKLLIQENYKLAKTALTSGVIFNISKKSVDTACNNAITNIDKEYVNFQKNKGYYSILSDKTLKQKKLQIETKKIYNVFLLLINPLIDPNYLKAIEAEGHMNEIENRIEKLTQNNITQLKNNVMFVADEADQMGEKLSGSYWF
jgi:hypothetical protein